MTNTSIGVRTCALPNLTFTFQFVVAFRRAADRWDESQALQRSSFAMLSP